MKRTYHDVEVEWGGKRVRLFDAGYGLLLTCCRVAGWELWNRWGGKEELLAGEYHTTPLKVFVAGQLVCGRERRPAPSAQPEQSHRETTR